MKAMHIGAHVHTLKQRKDNILKFLILTLDKHVHTVIYIKV
jgi:hypothetical protein